MTPPTIRVCDESRSADSLPTCRSTRCLPGSKPRSRCSSRQWGERARPAQRWVLPIRSVDFDRCASNFTLPTKESALSNVKRSKSRSVLAGAIAVAIDSLASTASADFTADFAAGPACTFNLCIEGQGGHQIERDFLDKNGHVVRSISAGTGSALTFTNRDTDATFVGIKWLCHQHHLPPRRIEYVHLDRTQRAHSLPQRRAGRAINDPVRRSRRLHRRIATEPSLCEGTADRRPISARRCRDRRDRRSTVGTFDPGCCR